MSDPVHRDAERLYDAVAHLVRTYQTRDRERICCHGISLSQWSALEHLVESGPLGLTPLAELLALDKSTASRVVDGLVRKGLAARVEDPDDRRAVRLDARRTGRDLFRRIRSELVAEEEALMADLSPEVRAATIELIRRLALAAQQRLPAGSGCGAPEPVLSRLKEL
jgi:MarR family transcriptional regulator, 2-MHQ and catechol-resistance regulon repressor